MRSITAVLLISFFKYDSFWDGFQIIILIYAEIYNVPLNSVWGYWEETIRAFHSKAKFCISMLNYSAFIFTHLKWSRTKLFCSESTVTWVNSRLNANRRTEAITSTWSTLIFHLKVGHILWIYTRDHTAKSILQTQVTSMSYTNNKVCFHLPEKLACRSHKYMVLLLSQASVQSPAYHHCPVSLQYLSQYNIHENSITQSAYYIKLIYSAASSLLQNVYNCNHTTCTIHQNDQ